MIGEIHKSTPVSAYAPSKDVADISSYVKKDYASGDEILHRSYVELNDLSPLDRDDRDKRTFNAFVDESVEDPSQAWRWRGTRSKARNKGIAMHSQITAGYIIPLFMAQNENSEEDRDFSDVMRDCSEWLINNSDYKSSYLKTSMGMLVNCVTYMGAEWADVYQKVKEKTEKGYTTTEILDEVLSGFQAPVYSSNQILISNAYEQNIQKHRFNITRRWIEYGEAEAKYGEHENWVFVNPGSNAVFNDADGLFYDVKDDDHPFMVEEVTYKNRRDDTEICFIGGIYMGDSDVEANPIRHRDNRNAPKYNVVPFGYQRIGEHFFFYKSLMNAQYWDNSLYDAQTEMVMNRASLETDMPVAITGTDKVDSDIIFPSSVHAFADKDVKISPLLPPANFSASFKALDDTARSMDEASVSDVSAGQTPDANVKATGLAIAERNAKTLLQGVGKTLAESMVQYGGLMADISVNHLSAAQIDEIVGDQTKLKYRTLILKNKVVNGKEVSKTIRFDESLLGVSMSDEQKRDSEMKMLEDTDYPDHKEAVYRVNPELFSRMRYLVRIEPSLMFPKNEEFMQAMLMQLRTALVNDPYISMEAIDRKLLYSFFRGEAEDIMQKQPVQPVQMGANKTTPAGAQVQNKATANGLSAPGVV